MKKYEKDSLIQRIILVCNAAKEEFTTDMGVDAIDYMTIAALEKLGLNERQIKKIFVKG